MDKQGALTTIKNNFVRAMYHPSDINEHLLTLKNYSVLSQSVLECGVRSCVSTWAFAQGLIENGNEIKKLVSVDIDNPPNIENVKNIFKNVLDFTFIKDNDLNISEDEKYDIIFIDTWHIEGQLSRELEKFHKMCNKYIIMHDTTIDEWKGESIRMKMNIHQQSKESGYTIEEICSGLWPAIDKFLKNHTDFVIKERFYNNNGLTILERMV